MEINKIKGEAKNLMLKNGTEITYCERGAEHTEVVITAAFYFHTFMPVVEALAERYHVYGIVMPVSGEKEPTDADGDIFWGDIWGSQVYEFAKQKGIERFHYVGKCHGTIPGWWLVKNHPEVLIDFCSFYMAPHLKPQSANQWVELMNRKKPVTLMLKAMRKKRGIFKKIAEVASLGSAAKELDAAVGKYASSPQLLWESNEACENDLRKLSVPVYYMFGSEDILYRDHYESNQYVKEITRDCKFKILPGEYHLMELDCPDRVAQEVFEFIDEVKMRAGHTIRIMNQPEDYKALGVNPNEVEPWEDGRRNTDAAGCVEWWYFDAETEDGVTVNVNFATNPPTMRSSEPGYKPFVFYNVQFADGTCETDVIPVTADECQLGEGKCDVRMGANYFRGDLKNYELHIENPESGVKIDLILTSTARSFRPGTAFFQRENGDVFTWLCAVPRGKVSGTVVCGERTLKVEGIGYHDHQWGTAENQEFWNRWLWGRQQVAGHTVLLFDFVSTRETGAVQYPVFAIIGSDGKVIVRNEERTPDVDITIDGTRPEQGCGKPFPDKSRYLFRSGDLEAVYELQSEQEYTCNNHYEVMDEAGKDLYDKRGIYPTISRYYAHGHLLLKRGGEVLVDAGGRMHYEVESLYANYILDAADREVALGTDPVATSREMRSRMAANAATDEKPLDTSGTPDAELAGTYDALINTPMGKQRGKIVFAVDGTTLSGTMDFMGRTYTIEKGVGTAEGFAFEINAKVMLRSLNAKVRGERKGAAITGTLTAPMGSIEFSGTRN